jgi:hypothetical protein
MTRDELFQAMVSRSFVSIVENDGKRRYYRLVSITMEDGSGYSFILTLQNGGGGTFKKHYRCIKPNNELIDLGVYS